MSYGESDKLYCPPVFPELPGEVDVLVGLGLAFSCHPKSRQNPISMMMRVQSFLLKDVGSGEGESGTPLAYIRSGAVPYPAACRAWVSSWERTQSGMRRGADVHSASLVSAERNPGLYLGS